MSQPSPELVALTVVMSAQGVSGASAENKGLNEAARSEMAGQIAVDSQAVIDRYAKSGAFVFTLSTNIAVARA